MPCATAIPVIPTPWVAFCWRIAPAPKKTSAKVPISSARNFFASWLTRPPCARTTCRGTPLEGRHRLLVQPLRQLGQEPHGLVVVLPVHDGRVAVDVPGRNENHERGNARVVDVEAAGVGPAALDRAQVIGDLVLLADLDGEIAELPVRHHGGVVDQDSDARAELLVA